MFDNIGGKLKGLAYLTAVGGASIFGIIGLVFLFISPIGSISYFVLAVSCVLSSWTIYGIGELIERSNSTDSMVSKILSEQAAPPKSVSIKKDEIEASQKASNKRYFVRNYYPGLSIQAVELQLITKENREVYVKVDLYKYLNAAITAVNIDLEFTNIFDDKWVFKDIPCPNLHSDGSILQTNEQFIQLDLDRVQSVKSVCVRINKYISDNKIVINELQDKEITMSDNELSDLKYISGINAVTHHKNTEAGWTCVCGTDNGQDKKECKLCGKSISNNKDSGLGDLNVLLGKLELLKTAREMQEYLVEYNRKYNNERLSRFIIAFKDKVEFERMYGNQRLDALNLIKKELALKSDAASIQKIDPGTDSELCRKCGTIISSKAIFCQRCGTRKIPEAVYDLQ